jgi:hypothetical protein
MQLDRRAVGYALLTALAICAYSVTDGIGARVSQNPQSLLWLLVANAAVLVPYGLRRDWKGVNATVRRFWLRGLVGGALRALFLWHRTLGYDSRADRNCCQLARDERSVRRHHRNSRAQGAAARRAHRGGRVDCLRAGVDQIAMIERVPHGSANAKSLYALMFARDAEVDGLGQRRLHF